MTGLLGIPFAAFFMTLILSQTGVLLREDVSTDSEASKPFDLPVGDILLNLIPLVLLMVVLAMLLKFFPPRQSISGFMAFGQLIRGVTAAALALGIVEYFTGVFSWLFGSWGLAPFIADEEDQFRASRSPAMSVSCWPVRSRWSTPSGPGSRSRWLLWAIASGGSPRRA